jgi:hypothetical protein
MIYAKTWIPGTDQQLDDLFEQLRSEFYQEQSYTLWPNYSKDSFKHCTALTISFDNKTPIFCSSILGRTAWHQWPENTYRIMNRYWRVGGEHTFLKKISEGSGVMVKSQLEWLKTNTDCKLAFISRQTENWQEFIINSFKNDFDIDFKMDNYSYCTCETPNDDSCWQKIIYIGEPSVLENWKRR